MSVPICGASLELPAKTANSPVGTAKPRSAYDHADSGWFVALGSTVIVTFFDSPGSSVIF